MRRYRPGEELELWELFYNTIRTVNSRDYSTEQVQTWAPDEMNREKWHARIAGMNPFVCEVASEIVGYAALIETGYIDHFYVHHQWQRQGVGNSLVTKIFETANGLGLSELTSDVSITAKPFFESKGFEVVAPQEVSIGEVLFRNYKMRKSLK
ncbi:GNAT family N-acetyltransferase [Thalassoglobus polymorphus]|uniref:GNAT family N-acetyltransferase n=1 Tax=Thalassoglobus polymorphus TaxID=2527994 RepID=UPI0018D27187|nr:GNAT family N-acetyltransferase [Thalassoglobus polymorphus]